MRLQIASDLHLEFPENRHFIKLNPLEITGDILLLAGDIIPLKSIDKHRDFFNFLSDHYKHTYWVPGNHEYYDLDIANRTGTFQESVRSNVTLLNNCTVELEKIRFHFTSLWSNISRSHAWSIEHSLMDFHLIKFEGQRLSVEQYNQMHAESLAFLNASLHRDQGSNGGSKTNVIVTHHVPTFQNYPLEYIGSPLNEAFATNLDDFIESSDADYWVYGHHHAVTGDFLIGNTKLVTNQLGYVHHDEHKGFDTARVLVFD